MAFQSNALCFGSDLPGQGVPGRVETTREGLVLTLSGQHRQPATFSIPFRQLSLEAGGFEHDQLVVKWAHADASRTLYIKDPPLIASIRQAAPPDLAVQLERAASTVRHTRASRRTVLLAMAGTVAAIVLGLWLGMDVLVEQAVERIPPEWERQLGEAVLRDALAGQTLLTEGPAVDAVKEMATRLTGHIPNNPYRFTVTVVRNPVVNAFALPGGSVVVFTGLIKEARSPEEVAGVLGHELNHVLQRHGMERIVKTLGIMAVAAIVLGDQQGLLGLARQLGVEIITLKYNRDQETEADLTGLRLLYEAKVDPAGMIAFFERLAQSEKETQRVELLSTHPMSARRAEQLKAELRALPNFLPEPFAFDWEKIQASLKAGEVVPASRSGRPPLS